MASKSFALQQGSILHTPCQHSVGLPKHREQRRRRKRCIYSSIRSPALRGGKRNSNHSSRRRQETVGALKGPQQLCNRPHSGADYSLVESLERVEAHAVDGQISRLLQGKPVHQHDLFAPDGMGVRGVRAGRLCVGNVIFEDIENLFGWWEIPAHERSRTLDVYVRCLNPLACLGAPNAADEPNFGDLPMRGRENNRTCAPGYFGRLCGSCVGRFARSNRFECVSCQGEGSTMLFMFFGGIFLMFVVYCVMVHMHIKAFSNFNSEERKKSLHSTLKRILLSHAQTVSLVLGLNVPYPSEFVSLIGNSVSWVTS